MPSLLVAKPPGVPTRSVFDQAVSPILVPSRQRPRSDTIASTARSHQSHPLTSEPAKQESPPSPQPQPSPPVVRKIPRPPNAFILYRSSKMRELAQSEPQQLHAGKDRLSKLDFQRELSKRIGELWRNETDEIKALFYAKSQQAAKDHAQRYPDYRYRPTNRKASHTSSQTDDARSKTKPEPISIDHARDASIVAGPLSGSGSGSGKRRASAELGKAKSAPYPSSDQRKASSGSISSNHSRSSRRKSQEQQPLIHPPLLIYGAGAHQDVKLSRSASHNVSSSFKTSAKARQKQRRSLDASLNDARRGGDDFSTLVPDALRAWQQVRPFAVGIALTTDATASTAPSEDNASRKLPVDELLRRALPPERRSLLEASLARKGLVPPSMNRPWQHENQVAQQDIDPTSQYAGLDTQITESWATGQNNPFSGHEKNFLPNHRAEHPINKDSQSNDQIALSVDPIRISERDNMLSYTSSSALWQAQPPQVQDLGPSIKLKVRREIYADYHSLADWQAPPPTWEATCDLGHQSTSQQPEQPWQDSLFSMHYDVEQQQHGNLQVEQQPVSTHEGMPNALSQSSSNVNNTNSRVLALSDPCDNGTIRGHLYGLDGELVNEATIRGNGIQGTFEGESESEYRKMEQAIQAMLAQMVELPSEPRVEVDWTHMQQQQQGFDQVHAYSSQAANIPLDPQIQCPDPVRAYPDPVMQQTLLFTSSPVPANNGMTSPRINYSRPFDSVTTATTAQAQAPSGTWRNTHQETQVPLPLQDQAPSRSASPSKRSSFKTWSSTHLNNIKGKLTKKKGKDVDLGSEKSHHEVRTEEQDAQMLHYEGDNTAGGSGRDPFLLDPKHHLVRPSEFCD